MLLAWLIAWAVLSFIGWAVLLFLRGATPTTERITYDDLFFMGVAAVAASTIIIAIAFGFWTIIEGVF